MSYAPSAEVLDRIDRTIAAYPERSAALLPVLHLIQGESGWISTEAETWVAAKLGILPIRVREVLSFYSMFRRERAGRTVIQVCRNLSCTLAGAEDVISFLRAELGLTGGDTTPDGAVRLVAVECLGNCDNAPCLQVDGVDHGRVTIERAAAIIRELRGK
jgi:NADH-quinone oxidoreductase E subunit